MAKKKLKDKVEATIKNNANESAVDFTAVKEDGENWDVKSVEVDSKTKLESDTGEGDVVTLRFFTFGANPEVFKKYKPTAQELFNYHLKQIEIELWKDGWTPVSTIAPRLQFSVDGVTFESFSPIGKQYTHYRFVIAARIAKGSFLSYTEAPKTLSELARNNK